MLQLQVLVLFIVGSAILFILMAIWKLSSDTKKLITKPITQEPFMEPIDCEMYANANGVRLILCFVILAILLSIFIPIGISIIKTQPPIF